MPKRPRTPSPPIQRPSPLAPLATRMQYSIGRGEQGVLTFEPYKGYLLPLWRFKTPEIAQESARRLEREFDRFEAEGDFVGADMARKYLQSVPVPPLFRLWRCTDTILMAVGMTRSMRYANRAGGRKYSETDGSLLPKSSDHPGAKDKLASAAIFREVWERVKGRERYAELRKEWERDKKEWVKSHPKKEEESDGEGIEREEGEKTVKEEDEEAKPARRTKRAKSGARQEDKPVSKRRRIKKEEDASD